MSPADRHQDWCCKADAGMQSSQRCDRRNSAAPARSDGLVPARNGFCREAGRRTAVDDRYGAKLHEVAVGQLQLTCNRLTRHARAVLALKLAERVGFEPKGFFRFCKVQIL